MPLRVRSIVLLLETLMAIHHYFSHRSRSLRYDSRYLRSSARLRGVLVVAASTREVVNSMWREVMDMSFTYRLKTTGGKLINSEKLLPACHSERMWQSRRTPQTSCHIGRML